MNDTFSRLVKCMMLTMAVTACTTSLSAQEKKFLKNATVYMVRHAEKDTGNNPSLTTKGRNRAGYLLWVFRKVALHKIFVTQYLRTQQTSDSLRLKRHIDTVHYSADLKGDALMTELGKQGIKNENILIIGHSNTLPILIGRLGIKSPVTIADDQYDIVYRIRYKRGRPRLSFKKFGDPKQSEANSGWQAVL